MKEQIIEVIKQIVAYFIEIFKFWGYIDQEDIDNVQAEIDKFKPAE